jgi:hypothetical protein
MMSVTDLNSRDTHIAGDKIVAIINTFFLHPAVPISLKAIKLVLKVNVSRILGNIVKCRPIAK